MVAVGDTVLKRKSKLIYVSHQIRFAALRGFMKRINLGKEDVPLTKEVMRAPMQRYRNISRTSVINKQTYKPMLISSFVGANYVFNGMK